jgi:hypothetical protein
MKFLNEHSENKLLNIDDDCQPKYPTIDEPIAILAGIIVNVLLKDLANKPGHLTANN